RRKFSPLSGPLGILSRHDDKGLDTFVPSPKPILRSNGRFHVRWQILWPRLVAKCVHCVCLTRTHADCLRRRKEYACPQSISTRQPHRRPSSSSPASPTSDLAARSSLATAPTSTSRCIIAALLRPTSQRARVVSGSACTTTGPIPTASS